MGRDLKTAAGLLPTRKGQIQVGLCAGPVDARSTAICAMVRFTRPPLDFAAKSYGRICLISQAVRGQRNDLEWISDSQLRATDTFSNQRVMASKLISPGTNSALTTH